MHSFHFFACPVSALVSQPLPHRVARSALELPEKVRELDCSVRELFDDLFCHERLLRRRERGMQDCEVCGLIVRTLRHGVLLACSMQTVGQGSTFN